MVGTEDAEHFTEELLNIVMDEIDDIIMIHDSEHTLVWLNRAALKAFNVRMEDVMGKKCYKLFGKRACCDDCMVSNVAGGNKAISKRSIPSSDEDYVCVSTPVFKDGKLQMVVQHLKKDCGCK